MGKRFAFQENFRRGTLCTLLWLIGQCCLSAECWIFLSARVIGSPRVLIAGGTGQIGSAVASHFLKRQPNSPITLAGRNPTKAAKARTELRNSHPKANIEIAVVDIWQPGDNSLWLDSLIGQADIVIHTAGPYIDRTPVLLQRVISVAAAAAAAAHDTIGSPRPKVYVDVSDPLPFLEQSLLWNESAVGSHVTAVVAAGAFPGMSNVLAMEAAHELKGRVQDLYFQYFTSGLGGSGVINLYITNRGFGDPMGHYRQGELAFTPWAGTLLGRVNFNFDEAHRPPRHVVGIPPPPNVFLWPFPEAATVATELGIRGNSLAAMGTAPDAWNFMLAMLVAIVPRAWWCIPRFSQFMADFSQPLVTLTDGLLKLLDHEGCGETHAMRIDATRADGSGISIVQGHDSFRQCVGQSCAEFALDCWNYPESGVYLPEQRYRYTTARARILAQLTTTPGTTYYSGPVDMERIGGPSKYQIVHEQFS